MERTVAAVWRIESAKIVATLTRMVGDFAWAEDLAQDAVLEALRQWPADGTPRNPAAWLTAVAKRRAIDGWRRQERFDDRIATIAYDLEREQADAMDADPWDPDAIDDDVLRLVFISCHPVLSREASVALTLRVVGGLSSEEIARAFVVPTATVQQRIVRAKKTLGAAKVPFEVPSRQEYAERLSAVLGVLYLIFNEGHAASSGSDWMRPELSHEAIRLTRVLTALVPRERDAHSLLALMELTAARFPARVDAKGEPILLADQDRSRWDRGRISRGRAALERADAVGHGRGAYGLQAAIAECHADRRVGRRHRLGADRRAVRGARARGTLADRGAEPGCGGRDGDRPGIRPAHHRPARRLRRTGGVSPASGDPRRDAAAAGAQRIGPFRVRDRRGTRGERPGTGPSGGQGLG